MYRFKIFPRVILTFLLLFFISDGLQGQILKKLGKRAERAVERTVENRVDREASKKTDEVLDSILEPGSKKSPTDTQIEKPLPPSGQDNTGNNSGNNGNGNALATEPRKTIEVYSKFDFVPGDKPLFYEDFTNDFIGDFPSKWDTNGSGEVVTINESSEKWLEFLPGWNTYYIPIAPKLPEDYTIEFDLLVTGVDQKTSSTAGMSLTLSNDPKFKAGEYYGYVWFPVGQYGAFNIRVKNFDKVAGSEISNAIRADIREDVLDRPHISIAVNGQRFRVWVNENKYVDIPRFMPLGGHISSLKFNVNNLKDGKERIFITNLKIAEGGLDLRRTLISEGKVSTNGILFDSGSANIQPQSMGIILQISQVLQQEKNMHLKITGHTDADGSDAANMELSKKRADAIKDVLVNTYNVPSERLQTEGKGETEPVGDNNTSEGKAQNRRVEFIKI